MTKSKLDKQKEKVEEMGIFFEQLGYTPMAGRVFSFLLLAEPPYKPFEEITEFLVASKSAISNALNFLMKIKMVDYITYSGDRKRYFRVNLDQWLNESKKWGQQVDALNGLLKGALEARADTEHPAFNKGLVKMIDLNEYLSAGLERLLEEWEEKNGTAQKSTKFPLKHLN